MHLGNRLGVIPARSGSKRIPHKNIRLLNGKPAIAYTIEAAQACGLFGQLVVSTDSEQIAEIAIKFGAEVPFLRTADLADDYTPVSLVTIDALNRLDPEGTVYHHVAQLMPNCPLRPAAAIRASYDQFKDKDADTQISVTRYGWLNPWWAMEQGSDYTLTPIFANKLTQRSQDLPELFCPTGAIWWGKAEVLRREMTFQTNNRIGWAMPWQQAVDVDTEEDWQMAEMLLKLEQENSAHDK